MHVGILRFPDFHLSLVVRLSLPCTVSLPHAEHQVAPGVYASGFGDRYRSAKCGWVRLTRYSVLIDLPSDIEMTEFLSHVASVTGKPVQRLILTHFQDGD
jgi:hypothetical protein